MVKEVIEETVSAGITFFPIRTATTERGWSLLRKPRVISLKRTITRMTLKEPLVEEAQPPMIIRKNRVVWQNAGHRV